MTTVSDNEAANAAAPAIRTPSRRSSSAIPRRAAHWVHTVTVPSAATLVSRSASGVASGSANSSARPGTENHAASPVSHSDTSAPETAAAAATVNAWLQRSASSEPQVTLTTSLLRAGAGMEPD